MEPRLYGMHTVPKVYADAQPLSATNPMTIKRDGDTFILIDSRNGMIMRSRSDGRDSVTMRMEILKTSIPALADYLTGSWTARSSMRLA